MRSYNYCEVEIRENVEGKRYIWLISYVHSYERDFDKLVDLLGDLSCYPLNEKFKVYMTL